MKRNTSSETEYQKRVNKVLHYIHTHLDEKLDIESLAQISNFSPFHFHRILRAFLQESLHAYINRIRMESAVNLILHTDLSMADIAYKLGYDVPSSFNKAFRKRFGTAPSEFREDYPYTSNINYLKQTVMELNLAQKPTIKTLSPRKVVYVSVVGNYNDKAIGEAWEKVWSFVKEKKLFGWKMDSFGISHDDPKVTDPDKCRYDACITISKNVEPEGEFGVKEIEGGKYAIFRYKGPYENFDAVYNYIYGSWLASSDYSLRDLPCLEKYYNEPKKTKPENLKTDIYLPIE